MATAILNPTTSHPHKRKPSHANHTYTTGDIVQITQSRVAIIKYIGKLRDIRGIWYGIEFIDGSVGSHNGTYKNTIYFKGADKRCEFIQKSDIRRKLKPRGNSTRNLRDALNSDEPLMPLSEMIQQPRGSMYGGGGHTDLSSMDITLKLRCMCFADPIPIELKVNLHNETMRNLKEKIINQCNSDLSLPLFSSIIENKLYSRSVDLYELTMNTDNNHQQRNGTKKNVRLNNLNVKPGNMAYCILKKNQSLFRKLTLNNNDENTDNVPLKYYKLQDQQSLFVLFNFDVEINVIFQKTLFSKASHSGSGYEEKMDDEFRLSRVDSDEHKYHHQYTFTANINDKFDKLYLKIMQATDIENINSIKLLSNNFIYNKSMMIEKFVYNEIGENNGGDKLSLYFVHLHQLTNTGHHKTRTRNYSLMSNYSTYSVFSHHALGSGDRVGIGANSSLHNVYHSNHSSSNSIAASNFTALQRQQSNRIQQQQRAKYTKILLNFVSAKKSESYTILDKNITIKQLRDAIAYKYKCDCDRIKLNNDVLDDKKLIKDYNINTNAILHIYDESNITIKISQSQLSGIDSANKEFEIKIGKKLTIKHIKFEISKILKYPMMSQTLIMKEILKDNQQISNSGIRKGDTIRLVYNFGKRVKKLPNDRLKIPIVSFNTNKRFEIMVDRRIFIYEIMQLIQREKGIDYNKQRLLFHGTILEKEQRLNYYNITHELHLLIVK